LTPGLSRFVPRGQTVCFHHGIPKLLGTQYPFHQSGKAASGFPIACRIWKSTSTILFHQINAYRPVQSRPAQLLVQTGNPRLGYLLSVLGRVRPCTGIRTCRIHCPNSGGNTPDGGKHFGAPVFFRVFIRACMPSHGEPVLYLDSPPGVSASQRRKVLDAIDEINQRRYAEFGDPETLTRIASTKCRSACRWMPPTPWISGRNPKPCAQDTARK